MEYNLNNSLIKFNNIDEYVKFIKDKKPNTLKKNNIYYINEPVSFDIETTSIGGNTNDICENKYAFMYIWAFSFCGYVYYARTWNEFFQLIGLLKFYLGISLENRLVIYVHNLAYEFQFIRKLFEWESVFSLSERKPIKAVSKDGIEFRCSYHLSGYSLALLGRGLNKYKVEKMVGDLDYSLIRTKLTPLTDSELKYVINDVLVVTSYIQEKIELDGGITKIPLTKTGYVRNYCRERCLYVSKNHHQGGKKFVKYRRLMKELVLTPELYAMLKQAFMGGFTHANPLNSNQTHQNVYSFDFTSSYPYVMVSEKFPMSKPYKFKIKNEEDLSNKLDKYCCVFYVEFTKIESTIDFENYIPKSHCLEYKNISENNGRIITADFISMVLTEQDYMIISKTYKWSNIKIGNFYAFEKDFLPRDFVLSILDLYKNKTELKGVEGKEIEYNLSKEQVNSAYGMMVTDICREEINYKDSEWSKEKPNLDKAIKKYNNSIKRFLSYAWGIWVTAYARVNLWTGILEFKEDYIYSDTDSIKVLNLNKHKEYIEKYNKFVERKLEYAMLIQEIDFDYVKPKTIKGEEKMLGLWSEEPTYDYFKTLGAKRYMYKIGNELNITVSGLNKKVAVPYIEKTFENPFKAFNHSLYIPRDYTGKMTHTYIDEPFTLQVTDYLGNTTTVSELSYVHLEPCDYSLSLSDSYLELLFNIQHQRR